MGNSVSRGAWWGAVHGVAEESDTSEQLNNKRAAKHYSVALFSLKKSPSWLHGQEARARGQDWVFQERLSLEEAAGLVVP